MVLEIKSLTMKFGGLVAIDNVSLSVKEGVIHSIIGPNGAGKSTLFNCISRFYIPTVEVLKYNQTDLTKLKPSKIIEYGIARCFQNIELFSEMTVMDNLLTGYHKNFKRNIISAALQTPAVRKREIDAKKKAESVLEILRLTHIKNEVVKNLSYGHQKMADIGRALMSDPQLILLDEPVAGLNDTESKEVSDLILKLKNDMDITVLLIEHDMNVVMNISDRINVLNFGKMIAEGNPKEVIENPLVLSAYLGSDYNNNRSIVHSL